MKLIGDFHTHSLYSGDGKGTLEENVIAAIDQGLTHIAATDHGPRHLSCGVKKSEYPKIFKEIERLQTLYGDKITILKGIEANFISLDGEIDVPEEYQEEFDFIALGHHRSTRLKGYKTWWHLHIANRLFKRKDWVIQKNTDMYENAIKNNNVDLIVHPNYAILVDIERLAKVCAQYKVKLEINAHHEEMSKEHICIAKEQDVVFCINSDGHTPQAIGQFEKKRQLAIECGLSEKNVYNASGFQDRRG